MDTLQTVTGTSSTLAETVATAADTLLTVASSGNGWLVPLALVLLAGAGVLYWFVSRSRSANSQ